MATYKTPGVFIEEIQTIAPSVAPVPTAIPGFVGHTFQAILPDGTPATNKLVRITSLLEYEQIFGGPFRESFTATVSAGTITAVRTSSDNYILHYQVQMFYANGGGTCFVVSVGDYSTSISKLLLIGGLNILEQSDEITLLVVPETVFLTSSDARDVNDDMLVQCAKLQDRFSIFDVAHGLINTSQQDADTFRNSYVSADNLKYGGAYYPPLKTTIPYFYIDSFVSISGGIFNGRTLDQVLNGVMVPATFSTATVTINGDPGPTEIITINTVTITPGTDYVVVTGDTAATALNFFNAVTSRVASVSPVNVTGSTVNLSSNIPGAVGAINISPASTTNISTASTAGSNASFTIFPDKALYNSISTELAKFQLVLGPSATMAGVYSRVDNDRGVWKAPANVSVFQVAQPSVNVTDQEQENLNVDTVGGKSINVIRTFSGRGNLVWGARTLAGNDNEWRYINVRRLFIFVEVSVKKASEFVVFEGNTAVTWNRLRSTIESFLTEIWREGALAGATTKDAYFVRVGLGTTMTAQDILEGRLIVEIGMAAVRPAEFIILRFMHKLQES